MSNGDIEEDDTIAGTTLQDKAIELTNRFPELFHKRREDLCAAFSEAIEWGRNN